MKVEAAMAMIEYIDIIIRSCFSTHSGIYPYIIIYYLCVIIQVDLVRGEGKKMDRIVQHVDKSDKLQGKVCCLHHDESGALENV